MAFGRNRCDDAITPRPWSIARYHVQTSLCLSITNKLAPYIICIDRMTEAKCLRVVQCHFKRFHPPSKSTILLRLIYPEYLRGFTNRSRYLFTYALTSSNIWMGLYIWGVAFPKHQSKILKYKQCLFTFDWKWSNLPTIRLLYVSTVSINCDSFAVQYFP